MLNSKTNSHIYKVCWCVDSKVEQNVNNLRFVGRNFFVFFFACVICTWKKKL